jgi:hypothetical protein
MHMVGGRLYTFEKRCITHDYDGLLHWVGAWTDDLYEYDFPSVRADSSVFYIPTGSLEEPLEPVDCQQH